MTEQNNGQAIALANFGDREEVKELTYRIKTMMPGGYKYTNDEALTLAQISVAHDLDPFNGEVWLIKNDETGKVYGALIGIKGHRKHAKRDARYWGVGKNGGFERIADPKIIGEYGATQNDIVFEYRIMDEKTLDAYTTNLERLTKIGIPIEQAQASFGPPPVTIGVGIYKQGDKTKMKPAQCAMFRAEKDALKRRFDVKFRVELGGEHLELTADVDADDDLAADEVEGEYEEILDEPRDPEEIAEELGYDPIPADLEGEAPMSLNEKVIARAIDAGYTDNAHAGTATLKHTKLEFESEEQGVAWFKSYRDNRKLGGDTKQAAKLADEEISK